MIVHNVLEPDFEGWVEETPLGDLAGDVGEVAFPALLALILLSWIKRIPYIHWEIPLPVLALFPSVYGPLLRNGRDPSAPGRQTLDWVCGTLNLFECYTRGRDFLLPVYRVCRKTMEARCA